MSSPNEKDVESSEIEEDRDEEIEKNEYYEYFLQARGEMEGEGMVLGPGHGVFHEALGESAEEKKDKKDLYSVNYEYTKLRKDLGKTLNLRAVAPKLFVHMVPDPELRANHIKYLPESTGSQIDLSWSRQEILTDKTPYIRRDEGHTSGGYPFPNSADAELVANFRNKLEKDDNLLKKLPMLQEEVVRAIDQNNAFDIYSQYFTEFGRSEPTTRMGVRCGTSFRDPWTSKRPIVAYAWEPMEGPKFVAAHAHLQFQRFDQSKDTPSYVWNINKPEKPEMMLDAGWQLSCVCYNPRDKRSIAAGMCNGQMCVFDTRHGSQPAGMSGFYNSFRDVPASVMWVASKTGTELFACSPDGQIIWWDVRHFDNPLEVMLLDLNKSLEPTLPVTVGVTALDYEPTVPNKFMAATEKGTVVVINRKGKTLVERISTIFQGHLTPVRTISRNPTLFKIFLTAGDWTWRIWSEECKESCILASGMDTCNIVAAQWNPIRSSVFYVARRDGVVDVWDLLLGDKPIFRPTVSNVPLTAIMTHANGKTLLVGDDDGTTTILENTSHLSKIEKQAKQSMVNAFEREAHREKLIEAKMREIRLKARTGDHRVSDELPDFKTTAAKTRVEFLAQIQKLENNRKNKLDAYLEKESPAPPPIEQAA